MADGKVARRNRSLLSGYRSFGMTAWTIADPSVVLVYLAVAYDMPVFLAGMLATTRNAANLVSVLFAAGYAAQRPNKKREIARTDVFLAACFVLAVISILSGSPVILSITFFVVVTGIGILEQYRVIVDADLIADTLAPEDRRRVTYVSMAVGGLAAIAIAWSIHAAMADFRHVTNHAAVIGVAALCMCLSALTVLAVRTGAPSATNESKQPIARTEGKSARNALQRFRDDTMLMTGMPWFRRYMAIRLALLSVRTAVPFFAILAALTHSASQRGLTAIIISTAIAYVVSGPIWGALNEVSNRLVMVSGCALSALSGIFLVVNSYYGVTDTIFVHAAALFAVTVAAQGVMSGRYLYYLDIAPKEYRARGLAVSKMMIQVAFVAAATALAAVAHMQHIAIAIAILAGINLCAAALVAALAGRPEPKD